MRLLAVVSILHAEHSHPTLPDAFETTFLVSTNAATLHEVPEDAIEVPIDFRTDGTSWRASYYSGLQVDMHIPEGNFKETYRNGQLVCMSTPSNDSMWKKVNILPTDLSNYTFVGQAIVRNLRVEMWTLPLAGNATSSEQASMDFYFDRATYTPVRWSIIRGRNPIFDAHRDLWNVDYVTFRAGPPCAMVFQAPANCVRSPAVPAMALVARPRGLTKHKKKFRGASWTPPEVEIAERLDWDELGFAGPIKDQGFCGSCWAFSMASTVSSTYALEQFRRGQKVDPPLLAEQKILDCGWSTSSHACDGGDTNDPELFGMEFSLASDYGGYLSVNGRCHDAKPFVTVKSWITLQTRDLRHKEKELMMQRTLYLKGPLSINVFCTPKFIVYHSGVLDDPQCADIAPEQTDHAVVLVGYGTEVIPYWKAKNSWSVAWGEDGFIRFSRERDCGASTSPGFPLLQQGTPEKEMEAEIQS